MTYLLGIDSGLTVTKAVIFDTGGHTVGSGAQRVPQQTPQARHVERDMNAVWEKTQAAVQEALSKAELTGKDIDAIGVTAHGDGIYLIDADGNPTRPAILSMDSRAHKILDRWQEQGVTDEALALTGQQPYAAAPAALLAWLQEHEPEVVEQTRWAFASKDWIKFKLTGEVSTDPTEASTSFTNVQTQTYTPEAFKLFGLESWESRVAPIIGSAQVVGKVTATAAEASGLRAGTPVVSGLHDVDAAAIGTGAYQPGQLSMTAGTFSINQVISAEPQLDGRWHCRNFVEPGKWMNMAISPASATNLDWMLNNLCQEAIDAYQGSAFDFVSKEIEAVLDDASEVFYLPFLYGSPYGNQADAAFVGLRGWHGRGHMLRAVFEGVAFNHRTHIDALRSAFQVDEVRASGGATRSEIWSQMFADVLDLPIHIGEADEVGALGTAMCAGMGIGAYNSLEDAISQMVRIVRVYRPIAENQQQLQAAYQQYQEIANALMSTWR